MSKVSVFCDASVMSNGQAKIHRVGVGALISHNGCQYEISEPIDIPLAVHRAEARALAVALIRAAIILYPEISTGEIDLYSDSSYVVDTYNGILKIRADDELWPLIREIGAMFGSVLQVVYSARSGHTAGSCESAGCLKWMD